MKNTNKANCTFISMITIFWQYSYQNLKNMTIAQLCEIKSIIEIFVDKMKDS